jgi:hypothetical protein
MLKSHCFGRQHRFGPAIAHKAAPYTGAVVKRKVCTLSQRIFAEREIHVVEAISCVP